MTHAVIEFFATFPVPRLAIFIISLMPILELRLGLVAAKMFGVPLLQAAVICYVGNILPIPVILLCLKGFLKWLKRFKLTRGLAEWVERRGAKSKGNVSMTRGQFWGLLVFVAIPLPGTGGWSGALLATVLDMPVKRALGAICAGVAGAGAIMVTLTYFIPGLFGF